MLVVHRSARADTLVEALGEVLATPLADPVAAEVVAVPTRGVERWLSQQLSLRLGVAANIDFVPPAALVADLVGSATGTDARRDPWEAQRLTWTLVAAMDAHVGDPALAPLVAHLDAATPAGSPPQRLATARHLAGLFAGYARDRPDLLEAWAAGEVPAEEPGSWQAHLWRLALARIGGGGPAAQTADAVAALLADPSSTGLPERVSLFGLTRLAPGHLDVLAALAAHREVHLHLLHPSRPLWGSVAARVAPGPPGPSPDRASDPTAGVAVNPLLASWGRDVRELQVLIEGRAHEVRHHDAPHPPPATLLHLLQAAVRDDLAPPGDDRRPLLGAGDASVQVHDCHGRGRQVEVLRDAILHLLDELPDLEPRDVIVMCPDIEAFAPHVHAAFGTSGADGADTGLPELRVRLADRALRQTNPVLSVTAALLELAGARVTASEVLDLAGRPPVARRFGLEPDDLASLERWTAGTAVRWGLDAGQRRAWHLGRVPDGTWEAGLDRLLLGATMAADDCTVWGGAVPYDDLPSSEVDLAGRFVELVRRLGTVVERMSRPQPLRSWVDALVEGTALLAAAPEDETWQAEQVGRVLAEVVDEAGDVAAALTLEELRSLLEHRLAGRPTRANFRTGDLTISTLVPMRSVPHRVVALLGLDDGVFPRHPALDGDDLVTVDPRVGERDARSEDRQLLLDALMAATDRLVVTYSGRHERTNRRRPPAVPLAELLDVIDATVRTGTGAPAGEAVTVRHPLQGFDPRNYAPGELRPGGPWSYDRVGLGGARALRRQHPVGGWLDRSLDPLDEPVVQLEALVRTLQDPVAQFLRRRLGLWLGDDDDGVLDDLRLELDPLERWGVGDRLVRAGLAGVSPPQAGAAERARGLLPPATLADPVLGSVGADVTDLLRVAARAGVGGPARSLDVHVALADGRTVVGTVPDVRGSAVATCVYSKLAAKHRLAAWARVVALGAARPDLGISAVTVGRDQGRGLGRVSRLAPPAPDTATAVLAQLVDVYDRAMRDPLPLPCRAGEAWVARLRSDPGDTDAARSAAQGTWDGDFGDGRDATVAEVWGHAAPFRCLLDEPARPDERGVGWVAAPSRFATLAHRVWDPLLDHEVVETAR